MESMLNYSLALEQGLEMSIINGDHTLRHLLTIKNFCEVYYGISRTNQLVLVLSNEHKFQVNSKCSFGCLSISAAQREGNNSQLLFLACSRMDSIPLFSRMCVSIIERLDCNLDNAEAIITVSEECKVWKEVFRKEREPELIGLIGELIVYKKLLSNGKEPIWQYPNKTIQDFRLSKSKLLEVKTTTIRSNNQISIHGILQLDVPRGQDLFLAFVRLERVQSDGDYSIEKLTTSIPESCFTDEQKDALNQINIDDKRASFNSIDEIGVYTIDNEFPRIIPDSRKLLQSGENIIDVDYTLDLTNLKKESFDVLL